MNECLFVVRYNNRNTPALLETAGGINTNLYKRSISCLLYYNSPLSSSPFAVMQTFTPVAFAVTHFKFRLPLSLGTKTSFVVVAVLKNIAKNFATNGCLLPRDKFAWFVDLLLLSSKVKFKRGLELPVPLFVGESSLALRTEQQKRQNASKRIVSIAGQFFLLSRLINTSHALIAASRAWLKITLTDCLLKTTPTIKTEKPRPACKLWLRGGGKLKKTEEVTPPPNGLTCATSTGTNAFVVDVKAKCLKTTLSLCPGMVVTTLATFNPFAVGAILKKTQELLIIESTRDRKKGQ